MAVISMVIDNCAWRENCGGGPDLTNFWLVALSVFVISLFWALLFGKRTAKFQAVNSLAVIVKLAGAFVGIPSMMFFLFGGSDGEGGAGALISFFFMFGLFMFFHPFGEWIMSNTFDNDEED